MRDRIKIPESETFDHQTIAPVDPLKKSPGVLLEKNFSMKLLTSEGHEGFLNYIGWLGLGKDSDMVVLSSMHHFYYDAEEMKNVSTIINLKELNYINHTEEFIHSIYHIMPPGSFFIGCFVDNKKINGFSLTGSTIKKDFLRNTEKISNSILSKIPLLNMVYSLMDSRSNSFFSKRNVTSLLETCGLKVIDITDLEDRTFFCARRLSA